MSLIGNIHNPVIWFIWFVLFVWLMCLNEFNQLNQARPDNVIISITAGNDTFWYDLPLPDRAQLQTRLKALGALKPQPVVHIRADARADYAAVAKVVLAAQQAGIARIGFLTEPPNNR